MHRAINKLRMFGPTRSRFFEPEPTRILIYQPVWAWFGPEIKNIITFAELVMKKKISLARPHDQLVTAKCKWIRRISGFSANLLYRHIPYSLYFISAIANLIYHLVFNDKISILIRGPVQLKPDYFFQNPSWPESDRQLWSCKSVLTYKTHITLFQILLIIVFQQKEVRIAFNILCKQNFWKGF